MKLSTKCRYGLRAVIQISEYFGSAPCKRKDIAASQELSDSYLENILIMLKNGGIIDTVRGVNGGYTLNRAPSEITLLEVVTILEGSVDLVDCVGSSGNCNKYEHCVTRIVWKELSDSWKSILGNMTLQSLLDKQKSGKCENFSI